MSEYRAYDGFAAVYDRHWWKFSVDGMPVMERLLFPRIPAKARILDVGCGTGQPAARLSDLGYRVVGLDGSAEMLRFARRNAPKAAFFQADARQFALARPVDAAISLSDVLNHVLTAPDARLVLAGIADAVAEGGWLLFDLNSEEKYSRHWTESFGIVEDDQVCVVRASYEAALSRARFDATIFFQTDGQTDGQGDEQPESQQGGWRRSDLTILERCHPDEEIHEGLTAAGFGEVQVFDWQRDLDAGGEPAKTFWLCHKTRA